MGPSRRCPCPVDRRAFLLLRFLWPLCAAVAPCASLADSAMLRVHATLLPYTRLQLQDVPGMLRVSERDVQRGYVDAERPWSFTVTTNSPDQARIVLIKASDVIERASVEGLDQPVTLVGVHTLRVGSGAAVERRTFSLRFRFYLAQTAMPGTYPWPVQVSTDAL